MHFYEYLTLGGAREGYGTWFVSVSVSSAFSATTRNETTKQRVHRYTGFIKKKAIGRILSKQLE